MKILNLPRPGEGGRLGNQLFAIASCIGIALRHGYTPRIPADWPYRQHFNIPNEFFGALPRATAEIREKVFEFTDFRPLGEVCNLHGYFQSPKYWAGYEDKIRTWFTPIGVNAGSCNVCSVHHRRGDYVGNPNYAQLPMGYYLNAANYAQADVMGFSDDQSFAEFHHIGCTDDQTEIEDFTQMVVCAEHIISNSTFAWWAAYLSGGNVYAPDRWFDGPLLCNNTKDLYPDDWTVVPVGKYDLRDHTFVIPVSYDHPDRVANLQTVLGYLRAHFDTNIIVGEINTNQMGADVQFDYKGKFHRTRAINEMTRMAKTPYVVNYDADVIIPHFQLIEMAKMLRQGVDVAYPYDGTFYWMPKEERQHCHGNLAGLVGKNFRSVGATATDRCSYGGAVGYNVDSFFRAGGENEYMVSYGAEDQERWFRFEVLGLDVLRVAGSLYHIDHWRGTNSSFNHADGRENMKLWERIKRMNQTELLNFVKSWPWLK
jgi:hypothetical protein